MTAFRMLGVWIFRGGEARQHGAKGVAAGTSHPNTTIGKSVNTTMAYSMVVFDMVVFRMPPIRLKYDSNTTMVAS